jgi:hypothetical protein
LSNNRRYLYRKGGGVGKEGDEKYFKKSKKDEEIIFEKGGKEVKVRTE